MSGARKNDPGNRYGAPPNCVVPDEHGDTYEQIEASTDGETVQEKSTCTACEAAELRDENTKLRAVLADGVELLADCFWQWAVIENSKGGVWAGGLSTAEEIFRFFGIKEGTDRDDATEALSIAVGRMTKTHA